MASAASNEYDAAKTRLQKETKKRRAEEQFKQDTESKRQKQLFAIGKTSGLRDIVVDSNHQKVKVENSSLCKLFLKKETSDVDTTVIESQDSFLNPNLPNIKLEIDNSFSVKVEETLDLGEIMFTDRLNENLELGEQNQNLSEQMDVEINAISSKIKQNDRKSEIESTPEDDKFFKNYVNLLKSLVHQKYQVINVLGKLVKEFQFQPNSSDDKKFHKNSKNDRITTDDSSNLSGGFFNPTLHIKDAVQQLTCALTGQDTLIKELSTKVLKQQDELIGKLDCSVESIIKTYPFFDTNNLSLLLMDKIKCVQCGQLCKSIEALHKHTIYQHKKRNLPCQHCKNKYHTEAQLSKHAKFHHICPKESKLQGEICPKKLRRPKNLNKHMKTHVSLQNNPQECCSLEEVSEFRNKSEKIVESELAIGTDKRIY